jgi:hypothetical protein
MMKNKFYGAGIEMILGLAFAFVLVLRIAQIWQNPVDDYDTSSFILMIQDGFYAKELFFFDIAHPGLLSLLINLCQTFHATLQLPPIFIWVVLISFGFLTSCLSLFFLMRFLGCSSSVALIACLLYTLSPAISDVAGRSEENILFHTPFILAIFVCAGSVKQKDMHKLVCCYALVSCVALWLAAQHAQPFLIVCGGLFIYSVSEIWQARLETKSACSMHHNTLNVFLIFSLTGGIYYLVMHYLFYNPMIVRAYSDNFYSLFHNDSIVRYIKAYLLYAQGFLLTGDMPVNYANNVAVDPKTSIYLLGICVVLSAFALALRRRLIDCLILPALGFVFIYEPSASERWDTLIIAVIISLMSRFNSSGLMASDKRLIQFGLMAALLLITNSLALVGEVSQLARVFDTHESMRRELGHGKLIYADLDPARSIVSSLPRDFQLINIQNGVPKPGDAIYLKNGVDFVSNKFNQVCRPSKLSDLCIIGN